MDAQKIDHVLIVANWRKRESHLMSDTIVAYLADRGIRSTVVKTMTANEKIAIEEGTGLVICLGGDGTVLYCARYLHAYGIPILAINLGTFGFVTEISIDEWQEAIDLFLAGEHAISRRLMVRATVIRGQKRVYTAHALNEMVVASSGISKVISMAVRIGDTDAGFFRSDGMIIATPTGSTGYNLAAGGPILDVDLSCLLITPICPFTLSNRPLVVSGESRISITIAQGQRTGLMLSLDGQQNFALAEGDVIEVEKSQSRALLVVSQRRNFIEVLRDKLKWSGGMHA
ncbi:MAG: NAD(+)/NADH kinase [Sphaerochaeta sp.]|jgi:NAD+ kinase|nr:NAD(+)/NADH kinase [Sphaerochaeta sp.]